MAEVRPIMDCVIDTIRNMSVGSITAIIEQEREHLINWANRLPEFCLLDAQDQIDLLASSWNMLVVISIAHRSQQEIDKLFLATGRAMRKGSPLAVNVGISVSHYESMISELLPELRDNNFDDFEAHCLMAYMMFYEKVAEPRIESAFKSISAKMHNYWETNSVNGIKRSTIVLIELNRLLLAFADCKQWDYLLFPDNEPIKPFLLERLTQM